jgi:hypothetical protein
MDGVPNGCDRALDFLFGLDKRGQFVHRATFMSALALQKGLIFSDFFGGPFRARTGDPLIKSNDPQHTSLPDPDAIPRKSRQSG